MSAEQREPQSAISPFPLSPESTWQAVEWMDEAINPSNIQIYKNNLDAFWDENGSYFLFMRDMASFRSTVENRIQAGKNAYERGFIYGISAVRKRYEELRQPMPMASRDAMLDYYESLLIGENDLDLLALKARLSVPSPEKLDPRIFAERIMQGRVGKDLYERLKKVFQNNTSNLLGELRLAEPYFEKHLRMHRFYNTFGPHPGLAHGALDGYQLFLRGEKENIRSQQKVRELEQLNKMWDIGAK